MSRAKSSLHWSVIQYKYDVLGVVLSTWGATFCVLVVNFFRFFLTKVVWMAVVIHAEFCYVMLLCYVVMLLTLL